MLIVPKKWGRELIYINSDLYCFKRLEIAPGWRCSTHRHKIKNETFVLECGDAEIEVSGMRFTPKIGDAIHVPAGEYHWFGSQRGAVILEVSTHHSDTDVERLEDSRPLEMPSLKAVS